MTLFLLFLFLPFLLQPARATSRCWRVSSHCHQPVFCSDLCKAPGFGGYPRLHPRALPPVRLPIRVGPPWRVNHPDSEPRLLPLQGGRRFAGVSSSGTGSRRYREHANSRFLWLLYDRPWYVHRARHRVVDQRTDFVESFTGKVRTTGNVVPAHPLTIGGFRPRATLGCFFTRS